MLNRPVETELPFRKLHKNWGGKLWFRYFIAGTIAVIAIAIWVQFLSSIIDWSYPPVKDEDPSTSKEVIIGIISGVLGGFTVTISLWFRRRVHNAAHYGKELRDYINDAQKRYKITSEEAAELLVFDDDALLTIDNFFRYIGHKDQDDYLPKLQKFGTLVQPYKKGYLLITLYWQRGRGFFLFERYIRDLSVL